MMCVTLFCVQFSRAILACQFCDSRVSRAILECPCVFWLAQRAKTCDKIWYLWPLPTVPTWTGSWAKPSSQSRSWAGHVLCNALLLAYYKGPTASLCSKATEPPTGAEISMLIVWWAPTATTKPVPWLLALRSALQLAAANSPAYAHCHESSFPL